MWLVMLAAWSEAPIGKVKKQLFRIYHLRYNFFKRIAKSQTTYKRLIYQQQQCAFVNFYPFISGVRTIDPNFSVTIDSKSFDPITFEIKIGFTIQ